MAPKNKGIEWHEGAHVDASIITVVERGEVDQQSHPQLHQHLREVCDTCDSFMAGHVSLKDTDDYDLNEGEVERILRVVLDEIEEDRLRLERAAATPPWMERAQQWLWGWRATLWAVPAALGLMFLMLPGSLLTQGTTPPDTAGCEGRKNCRQGGAGAFLHINVDRKGTAKRLQAFVQNASYRVGDAMLFRFQVVSDGFLMLVREDARGAIEQVYPFPKSGAMRVSNGQTLQLQHKGQQLAYYLEPKHEGRQTFRLLIVDKPFKLPAHISKLTKAQRKAFDEADFMRFQVRSTSRR